MAAFYRLSLAGGRSLVTLEEEMRHVQTYVEIQNDRFDGAVNYGTAVEAALLGCLVPKLTLQPLVENAVVHGVREKPSGRGAILLSARPLGADMEIVVWDDGAGMDDDDMQAALAGGNRSDRHSFGVWNINQRLRLLYGERYGVSYESRKGQGTRAIVLIPARRET